MNIILFEPHEIGKPLPRRDERTIHLLKVLHKKCGDTFEAGILGDKRGTGRIESIKIDGSLTYSLILKDEALKRYQVRMAVGFPRPIQIRRILRDLSNLGILAIDLMGTELGEKSYRETKLLSDGGARAAMIEGAVQARDTMIPILFSYGSLEDWLGERPWDKPKEQGGFGSYRISPLLIALDNVRPEGALANLSATGQSIVLAVGSERGWTDSEREKLEKAGFLRLSMGERIMRTETACVAAAVLALEKTGVLG
ncbi:MAG: 16S rRNA (uracil(1498)-N(3))-methyltransferase [Treponema sp.]|nr:16S rRNA (uracil(1498)-N(3))-methyltransferase [Treponema sp.]